MNTLEKLCIVLKNMTNKLIVHVRVQQVSHNKRIIRTYDLPPLIIPSTQGTSCINLFFFVENRKRETVKSTRFVFFTQTDLGEERLKSRPQQHSTDLIDHPNTPQQYNISNHCNEIKRRRLCTKQIKHIKAFTITCANGQPELPITRPRSCSFTKWTQKKQHKELKKVELIEGCYQTITYLGDIMSN